jgi:hypothetical protein
MTMTFPNTATPTTLAPTPHDHEASTSPLPYECCGLVKDFSILEFVETVGTRWYLSSNG